MMRKKTYYIKANLNGFWKVFERKSPSIASVHKSKSAALKHGIEMIQSEQSGALKVCRSDGSEEIEYLI